MHIQNFSTAKLLGQACLICALVFVMGLFQESQAQIFETKKSPADIAVADRLPEAFRAPGIIANNMIFQPKITLDSKYDTNVLATQSNTLSDYSLTFKPSINILKEWHDHRILFETGASVERFLDETDENNEGYYAGLTSKIIGNSHWSFPSSFSYKKTPRKRESPLLTRIADKRLDIKASKAEIGVTRHFNRLSLTLLGNYSTVRYEDGIALNQVTPTIYSDNDRDRVGGILRFRYDLPRSARGTDFENVFFTNLIYGKKKYKKNSYQGGSFSGPKASHDEYGFLSGFNTQYKGLLFANIGAGLRHQKFDDSRLKDTDTTELYADISYNLTPKLGLNFGAKRDIDQDNGLTQGVVTSDYHIGADYELLHDLYAGAELGYIQYDFDRFNREDEDVYGSFYLKKFLNQNLESQLKLNYHDRQSNIAGRAFDRFDIIFSLTGKI